jgi:organic hydroperoxide reductase OsmC/OhrA
MDEEFTTNLEQVKDYAFEVTFDKEGLHPLIMDEAKPLGAETGPNASRLLSSAVGHCLSSSLLFCLQRSRIPMKHISTKVHTTLARNEAGRWRVKEIGVDIKANPVNEEDKARMKPCLDIFEDFCIVTQSVRRGINVQATVQVPTGSG